MGHLYVSLPLYYGDNKQNEVVDELILIKMVVVVVVVVVVVKANVGRKFESFIMFE